MKKIVAIIVIIAGFVVSASLFALASVAPSIAKMQASQQAFTLGGTLNPGETGLQSAPIAGKKAGDTLTAEEWNRVLEMLADGTGGGGSVASTAFYYCSNADSVDTSNIPCYEAAQNQGAGTQRYRIVSCNATSGPRTYTASSILNFGSLVANKWAFSVNGGTIECTDNTMVVVDLEASVSSGSG